MLEAIKSSINRAGSLRVESALNPFLWACAVISPVSWWFAFISTDIIIKCIFIIIGAIPVITFSGIGIFLAVRDPGRLQSEEYQIRTQALNIIEKKGGTIVIDPASLTEIANPAEKFIESGDRHE